MRHLRRLVLICLLLPVVSLGLAFFWLQTDLGRRQLVSWIENTSRQGTTQLEIGTIEGTVPFDMHVSYIQLLDRNGPWLQAKQIHLHWSALALLSRHLKIDTLSVELASLQRLPQAGTTQSATSNKDFLPVLPVDLELSAATIRRLDLASPVLGQAMALTLDAQTTLLRQGDLSAGLQLHRLDSTDGRDDVTVDLAYRRAADHLKINLAIAEPTGGVVSQLLGVPVGRKLTITGTGNAPLTRWTGSIVATLDDAPLLQLTGSTEGDTANRQIEIGLRAQPSELLPEALRPLAQGGLQASIRARLIASGTATRLEVDQARAKSDTLDLSADGNLATDGSGNLRWHIATLSSDAFARILPQLRWNSAMFEGELGGSLEHPTGHLSGRLDALQYDGNAIGGFDFSMDALPGPTLADPISVMATVKASEVVPAEASLAPLVKGGVRLTMRGSFDQHGKIGVDDLTIGADALIFQGRGEAHGWGSQFDATGSLRVDLAGLKDVSGLPLKGNLLITGKADRSQSNAQVTLDGTAADFSTGEPLLDGLLGSGPHFGLELARAEGQPTKLQHLAVRGKDIELDAAGSLDPAALHIEATGGINDVANVDKQAQGKLSWKIKVGGSVSHPVIDADIDAPRLTTAGVTATGMMLHLTIPDLATHVGIGLTAKGFINELPMDLAAKTDLPTGSGGPRLDLTALQLRLGRSSLTARGQFQASLATGELSVEIPEMAELKPLTQLDAKGKLTGDAKFAADGGRQNVRGSLTGDALSFGNGIAARHLEANADITDLFASTALATHLTLDDTALGTQHLRRIEARLDGPMTHLVYDLRGTGPAVNAKIAGSLSHTPRQDRVGIDSADFLLAGQHVTLLHSTALTRQDQDLHLDTLALQSGTAQASLTADMSPQGIRAKLDITHLALDQLTAIVPQLPIKGEATGHLNLDGTASNPQAHIDARIDHLSSIEVSTPPATATATADWQGGRLNAVAKISSADQKQTLLLSALLAIPANPANGLPQLDGQTELAATAKGHFDLTLINALLPSSVDHVGGQADVDLTISGSIAAPDLRGRLVIADGRYDNLRYGTRIKAIQATVTATGARLELTEFSAKTPGNGSLSGSGDIDLTRPKPIALRIQAHNAQLIDNAMASAAADADLTITSLEAHQIQLAGKVKIVKAELRIPDRLSSAVQEITVDERNVGARTNAPVAARASPPPLPSAGHPTRVTIDMDIDAPQQVAVRGRGLDAELGGRLHVGGDIAQPVLTGQLKLRRGKFTLVGRSLKFDHGAISFDGGTPIDPQLDFAAKAKANSYDITANVSGTATKPTLGLTSNPALPQDEILAQLLFGRAAGSLSALQAVQLAQATAELAGVNAGPDVLDNLRRATGLDRLSIDAGEDKTTTSAAVGPSLSAGRYIAPGVYLGVKQGTKVDSSAATVEIDVTPHVKVETDVGGAAGSKAGVNMQWDY